MLISFLFCILKLTFDLPAKVSRGLWIALVPFLGWALN